jgi:hypothetical protein
MNTLEKSRSKKWTGLRWRNPEKIEELRKSGELKIAAQRMVKILENRYPELAEKV